MIGKQQSPLTEIDVALHHGDVSSYTTCTTKHDVEMHLIQQNQKHSKQALNTPLMRSSVSANIIDPMSPSNKIDDLLQGTFHPSSIPDYQFNQVEQDWFSSLKSIIHEPISLALSIDDFQTHFKHKKECTASSPSGCHMGHYKTMLECIHRKNSSIPEIVILIAHMSLLTSSPLSRREYASQLMLEKGKGQYFKNLRIIQLCEADLNFVLHVIWGKRLMHHALRHLDKAQFAIPGQTFHNAVLNKLPFLDLSRQTFTPGLMLDYDAKAAFDRVISVIANAACQRLGLPSIAGIFMHKLLHDMSFHVVTGYGRSTEIFCNSDNCDSVGQGVLQGSSSACPIYIFNSDACLSTYRKHATMTKFVHPITGDAIQDSGVQFVDDMSQFVNSLGCEIPSEACQSQDNIDTLYHHAQQNISTWNDILGGKLHPQKCYFYSFCPTYNFKRQCISYQSLATQQPLCLDDEDNKSHIGLEHISPYDAKRTLGVTLAPDGSAVKQLQLITLHAREIQGKLHNSSLLLWNRWIALSSIIEPSLLYPLVNTYFTSKQIQPYECIMSTLQCNALGLNSHFPRALLHSSVLLGGIGIPSQTQKTTKDRINYFLYNVQRPSITRDKFEASILFTQLEVGTRDHHLCCSYNRYGHLATISYAVQLWAECKPFRIKIKAAPLVAWTPPPCHQ